MGWRSQAISETHCITVRDELRELQTENKALLEAERQAIINKGKTAAERAQKLD